MAFKDSLKKLRIRNNLNQIELADKLNVKQYVISSWEIGRSEPSINQLIELSNIFKVPVDYLLDKDVVLVSSKEEFNVVTNEMIKDSIDDFEDCINKIRDNCSVEQKKEISNILKSLYNITK
ncbi:MAG: helix-turn-helix domain-containing protein [Roseburia sp.]|nr:helix-turn-helix domain-containing protein [Anaeroplasma bactoclasticum]MCM1197184.1 helix-turn-helix domain-containing protein [Roseburia sp.]MCM1556340.1 helix-turn-helix domain-containing protein [Anaeroplasma bactoclasticum]